VLRLGPTRMLFLARCIDGKKYIHIVQQLLHLADASKVQVNVYENKIPIDPSIYTICEEFNLNTTTVALNGGEDYELLFTLPIADHDKIKANPNLTVIGYVKEGTGANLITRDEKVIALKAQGFNHME
jgi:thiamine-monophosphate kinase